MIPSRLVLLLVMLVSRALAINDIWIDMQESTNYTARHECSFVQAGDKFYMFGGREDSQKVDIYDYATNTWTLGASAPVSYNHFQATEYQGLVWVIGAFKNNNFPNEDPALYVGVYDPANNVWMQGSPIPRPRGGGGLVVHNDKFYLVGGNTNGHAGQVVTWFDEYNPYTGEWGQLLDAPHARDHFHAALADDQLYAIGGRRTKSNDYFNDTVAEVDVYDFSSGSWLASNLPPDLPSPRAGTGVAVFDGKIMIMGGESGEQGEAYARVDALDVATGSWESLSPMNHGRHGTQAIISGQGVYIAGGSPNRGGGNQLEMEVYNADAPAGSASTAGVLSDPFEAEIFIGASQSVRIEHVGGTQGVLVQSIALGGQSASDFEVTSNIAVPVLIGRDGVLDVLVEYTGATDGAQAWIDVSYSGNQNLRITLVGRLAHTTSPVPTPSPTLSPTKLPMARTPSPSQSPTKLLVAPSTPEPTTQAPTIMPVVPATPEPTTADPLAISDIVLVNSTTNSDIVSLLYDSCDGCIGPSDMINVRADTFGDAGSMQLTLVGLLFSVKMENAVPYALFGDIWGNYNDQTLPPGDYTVTAQAFSSGNLEGTAGPIQSVTFSVATELVGSVIAPPPTPALTLMPVIPPTLEPTTELDPLTIVDFVLVNSTTNNDITSLLDENCNGCIGPFDSINIRADVLSDPASVTLAISPWPTNSERTEVTKPYALFGDLWGDYFDQTLSVGSYTVTAQAFNEEGSAGPIKSVTFTVSD